uniref:Uncharacterized protein n=1 Tax=Anopheles atroparvus TaxID=41427 RepID=A0A182IVQ5_ANOAO
MVDEGILLPNACRCCLLEDKDMVYVFDVLDEFEMQISDLIARNGAITILVSDCFSKHICGNCLNDLAIAERFTLRCRKTDDLLLGLSKTQLESDPDIEKVSYVLMTEPLYEEESSHEPIIEGYADIVQDDSIVTAEAKTTKELDAMYCISEEEEAYEEEQLENTPIVPNEIIITEGLVFADADTIIAEEPVEVEDVVYQNLLQDSQSTPDVVQSDDFPAELIHYEERLSDDEKNATIASDDEFERKAGSRKKLNFNHKCSHEKKLNSHELHCKQSATLETAASKPMIDESQHDVTVTSYSKSAEALVQRKKTFECSYCSKPCVSQSALAAHLRTHTGERPFGCSYCPKRFKTTAALDLHERRHTGLKPYTCSVCGKGFTESSNLKVHMRQHTREKPHVCTVCNRAFARVFLLQLHQRTHTGEKPYGCEVCGKGFSQQGDLAAHRRIHSGERPFVCSVCGKGFIKSTALTQHRKSHERHLLMGSMAEEESFRRSTVQELVEWS